jgi:hypothetical protein
MPGGGSWPSSGSTSERTNETKRACVDRVRVMGQALAGGASGSVRRGRHGEGVEVAAQVAEYEPVRAGRPFGRGAVATAIGVSRGRSSRLRASVE